MKVLTERLRKNATLTSLDLSSNALKSEGASCIAQVGLGLFFFRHGATDVVVASTRSALVSAAAVASVGCVERMYVDRGAVFSPLNTSHRHALWTRNYDT